MAESSVLEAWKTTIPCRYYANGMCREGDRCQYLHVEGTSHMSSEGEQTKNTRSELCAEGNPTRTESTSDDDSDSSNAETDPHVSGNKSNISKPSSLSGDTSSTNISTLRSAQVNQEPTICQYFQQGCCRFGDNCRNKHEVIENNSNSPSLSRSDNLPENSLINTFDEASTSVSDANSLLALSSLQTTSNSSDSSETSEEKCMDTIKGIESKTKLRVTAPEFIPGRFSSPSSSELPNEEVNDTKEASSAKTWAQIVNASAGNSLPPSQFTSLCPYAEAGDCPYAEACTYLHGDTCEFCGNKCLHPTNEKQRKAHTDDCIKQHEREMELAFAVARSKDKQCGVCFEVVVDKNPASEQRFGILPNCNHCFCLACIRKWRQAKQFENKIIRACPECRVTSDFVCPSMYWVDTKEEKDKLIMAYKDALSNKQCKYFKQGRGKCPFGNKCFYLHALTDGTKVDTGPPIRRHRQNADGDTDVLQMFLWDFLDERDNRWLHSLDDLDLLAFLSGSDDSDSSDVDIF
ncbi:probable E3 ubiquitin-protein ligase makorin-1 isoform X1 [Frankliniella occidentalis]|uniref:RING-type E3 ubiquitin transferase n=2 Tax=Frankliniella occidentalis TaxID=133901 RepID=A0A6J1TBW2_FRAOC|nr:probable E3 ubiquitin-protein ligase makorin-1 isoform X1 [Frankliniella occidentalis]XP_026290272.1 probable E3 ubiquitin-protein ligase makorin-1 isoform X1 [Frankliniella occidentalis]